MRKEYPLVSIRIPLYNHEKYIQQTLDSIKNDYYPNKEIIIIDDGSKDNSVNIVKKWINDNQDIKVIFKYRQNIGVTKTLNELHSLCSGKYIVGIASDDYLINNSIYVRYMWLLKNKTKKIVFTDCHVVDENNIMLFTSALKEMHNLNVEQYHDTSLLSISIIKDWGIVGGTLMYDRSIIDEYRYDENSSLEDYDFFLFGISNNYIGYLDFYSSCYRIHSRNTSANSAQYYRRQKDLIKALVTHFNSFNTLQKKIILSRIILIIKNMSLKYIKKKGIFR